MSTSLILGVAGAAIGFFTGGASYVAFGFLVGSLIGNLVDPPKVEGPRLSDLKVQTSQYGKMIPYVWGWGRLAGNVIDQTDLIEHKNKSGGKGGPEITEYTYTASFAIALCHTPIFGRDAIIGITRLWADGRLIWSATGGGACPCTVYVGSEDQLPDPTFEAIHGVGNVPAYRGIAYLVFADYLLTDFGNRIPQIEAEVFTKGGVYPWRVSEFDPWPGAGTLAEAATYRNGVITTSESNGTDPLHYYMSQFNIDGTQSGTTTEDVQSGIRVYVAIANLNSIAVIDSGSGVDVWWANPDPDNGVLTLGLALSPGVFTAPEKVEGFSPVYMNDFVYAVGGDVGGFSIITRHNADGGIPANYIPPVTNLDAVYASSIIKLGTSDTGDLYVCVGQVTGTKLWKMDSELNILHFWDEPDTAGTRLTASPGSGTGGHFHVYKNQICFNYRPNTGPKEIALVRIGAGFSLTDHPNTLVHTDGPVINLSGGLMIDLDGVFSLDPPAVPVLLSEIVGDLSDNTPAAGYYDVTELTDEVRWFPVASVMTVRNAIAALRPIYFFDAVESDDLIKFRKRGGPAVFSIPDSSLCGRPYGEESGDPLRTTRTKEQGLPRTVSMTFIDVEADYQPGTRSSPRQVTLSQQDVAIEVPVGLTGAEALQKCLAVHTAEWVEREVFDWATTRGGKVIDLATGDYIPAAMLEPCDVGIVRGRELRILTRTETPGGVIKWTGVLSAPSVYTQNAPAGSGGFIPQVPAGEPVSTELVLLDIPLISQADSPYGFYAAMGPSEDGRWTGAALYKSLDGGVTYRIVAATGSPDVIGRTAEQAGSPFISGTLGPFGGSPSIDTSTIRVVLTDDDAELVSVTDDALALGANLCAIGRADGSPQVGNWELCQFRDAVLVSANTYLLSNWLRGAKGSATTGHANGDIFVLLPVTNVDAPPEELNVSLKYKAVTFGTAIADAAVQDFINTGLGFVSWVGNPPIYDGGDPGPVPPPDGGAGSCRADYVLNECGDWVLNAGGGGGAPINASYIVAQANGTLTNELVLTAGANVTLTPSGGSPPTALTVSVGSPLTTKGDIWVYDGAADTRQPVGADGQVLVADSAQSTGLAYGNRSAVGGWVFADQVVTASSATTVTLSIPGGYTDLTIRIIGRDTGTSATIYSQHMYINADTTAANYSPGQYTQSNSPSSVSGGNVASTTAGFFIGSIAGSNFNTDAVAVLSLEIPGYAQTVFRKMYNSLAGINHATSGGSRHTQQVSGAWFSTAAITSVTFTAPNTAFADGSIFTAYVGGP